MKKILFLDQYSTLGGGQSVLLQLLELFAKRGWKVVAAFPCGGELEKRARSIPDIEIRDLPTLEMNSGRKTIGDVWTLALYFPHLLKILAEFKNSDYVYVNGPRFFPLAGLLSLFIDTKFIYHIHLDHTPTQKKLIANLLKSSKTCLIIANSTFTRHQLNRYEKSLERDPRVKTIHNSLSRRYAELPFRIPEVYGPQLKFITVGRISPEKGQGLVIDLALRYPHHTFYIVGAPDFGDFTFQEHLQKKAPGNVLFVGKTVDVPSLVKEQQISGAIIPSQVAESFGLVAIEAMASSCATIVSDRGELFNTAQTTGALMFKDFGELEKAFLRLTSMNRDDLTALVHEQYTRTLENFKPERFENEIMKAIE